MKSGRAGRGKRLGRAPRTVGVTRRDSMAEIVAYISRAEVEGKGAKTGGTNPHK